MKSMKKPAFDSYFPMSDTEDIEMAASEPYSSEYHAKMANRLKPSTLDAVHDDTAIDSFDAPSSSRSGATDNQPPIMLISSVRSLHSLSNGIPAAENSNSVSDSQDSVQLQHRKMFGIAKINPQPGSKTNRKSSKLISLLKEVEPPQQLAAHRRRNRTKGKPPQAVSKIGKLRKAFDHVYKGRIHSQGPVMENRRRRMASSKVSDIVAAAAKSSDDETDEEENDNDKDENYDQSDENSSQHDDSSRSSAPIKQSIANSKVTPSPPTVVKQTQFAVPPVTGSSRRKTAHKPIANDEDIIFVDVGGTVVTVAPRSTVSANVAIPGPSKPIQSRPRHLSPPPLSPRSLELQGVRAIKNPNADLIKKVAFLRCCVNYMMFELNRKPYSFHRYSNLVYLTSRYKQNQIVRPTKK